MLLYVDDMLIVRSNKCEINKSKKQLMSEFETKELENAKKILGMSIAENRFTSCTNPNRRRLMRLMLC